MKLIVMMAALAAGTAAFAQPPADPAPAMSPPAMAPMGDTATPAPAPADTAAPMPMASPAPMAAPADQAAPVPMAATGDYPPCTRTMQDKCTNSGSSKVAMKHRMTKKKG